MWLLCCAGNSDNTNPVDTFFNDESNRVDSGLNQSSNVMLSKKSLSQKIINEKPVESSEIGNGAYLTYNQNTGTFYVTWRQEAVPEAYAYGKPSESIKVPHYKYKSEYELKREINRDPKTLLRGYLQFIKTIQSFQPEFALLPGILDPPRLQPVIILLLTHKNKIIIVEPNGKLHNFSGVIMIAVCLANTLAEKNLRQLVEVTPMNMQVFTQRCKLFQDQIETTVIV